MLLDLSSRLSNENASKKRLKRLFKYVECVEELNAAINTVCDETEVEAMKFDDLLDEALMNLEDEFEALLQQLKHQKFGELQGDDPLEMDVRYKRLVKALLRLNPDYLKTYTPEGIDEME
ncbi:hypothetical protein LIER_07753 [Lithospermum erythrorhizon]|uniref:Uncharacterized protein n=1 Tax=Lithospermum erythrorhizon TaxID=34254 RepID=A0AAV3PAP9_LITER